MIKELWFLIKLLFTPITDKLELVSLKHFPFKGYLFMMWCGKMIYRKDNETKVLDHLRTQKGLRSIRHETIHLMQAKDIGSWIKFYLIYVWEWIKGNPLLHPAQSAYYTIPFEVQAYALEDTPERYTNNLAPYTINGRKKFYKQHRNNFREFVKTL